MLRRLIGGAAIALLILAVAVTPLSAVVQPNDFELPFQGYGCPNGTRQVMAHLHDETGLVENFVFVPYTVTRAPQTAPTRELAFNWDGDSGVTAIRLDFSAPNGQYKLEMSTTSDSCPIGVGLGLGFAVMLRAPIDPTQVTYEGTGSPADD